MLVQGGLNRGQPFRHGCLSSVFLSKLAFYALSSYPESAAYFLKIVVAQRREPITVVTICGLAAAASRQTSASATCSLMLECIQMLAIVTSQSEYGSTEGYAYLEPSENGRVTG